VQIEGYVSGDDLRITRTYTELPDGIIISKAYLTIKERLIDSDAEAIIQKTITSAEDASGSITDPDTTGGSIALYFDLSSAETLELLPVTIYAYDVQVITQAGAIYTCEKGTIVMHQGVTDAIN